MIGVGLAEGSCFPWFGKNLPGFIWNKKKSRSPFDFNHLWYGSSLSMHLLVFWNQLVFAWTSGLKNALYYHENLTLQYNFLLEMDDIVKKQLFYSSPAPSSRFELSFLLMTPRERATLPSMTSIKHAAVKLFPLHLLLYLLSPHSALLFVCSALLWHR